eukprot:294863-Rhodomonas_salina.4
MDFRNGTTGSFGADSATPCVRLTQDDVINTDISKPGTLKKLFRKLHGSGKKRQQPGSACVGCRLKKRSCDGSSPCSRCVLAGHTCIRDEDRGSSPTTDVSRELRTHPEPPISQCGGPCHAPMAASTDPMCPSLGAIGMLLDCGLRVVDVSTMLGSCPLKLRSALHRLSGVVPHLVQNQAVKRKPLPEVDEVFESEHVSCWQARYEPDGSTVCLFNDQAAYQYGEISRPDVFLGCLSCLEPAASPALSFRLATEVPC